METLGEEKTQEEEIRGFDLG